MQPFFVADFYCTPDEGGSVWDGIVRGQQKEGEMLFVIKSHSIPPTHLDGLEAWLHCSIFPQRAVNHTLSNVERWLQAPSTFIINH